ncbi:MAG: hypothetical protein KBF45_08980 [Cyclobacteriaceae bacterium]|jgi:hypothetical protein|nr:hypothetical protein [Cyclobacteriaceae bacterium]
MKTKFTFLSILSVFVVFGAVAQGVEYDDVYFRSKDRVVLAASKRIPVRQSSKDMEVVSTLNPTDSYSARNVNPEYLSQSTLNPNPSATSEAAAYFVPNYMPASVNQNIKKSSDYSNYSNTPYGGSSLYNPYYGNSCMSCYGGMGSYGSLYSPYGNPYGYSGLSMSMGLGYGSMGMGSMYGMSPWSMGYGMGMNYGMGMGMNYGMGYGGYGYNSGFYQPRIIVTGGDTNGSGTVYGKRSSRSSELNNVVTTGNRQSTYVDTRGSSGRVSGNESNANAGSYYQRGWRANPETNTRLSSGTTSNPWQQNRNNNGNNSWMNNSGNSRSSNWSDTNRGGSNMGAIGGRSSGSSSGGGSSSGVRHGRN